MHLHLSNQQNHSSNTQEGRAAQETLQPVGGAEHSRAPRTNSHVNGDHLSVFDDSSLSDVSDDEGRYICSMLFFVLFPSLSLTLEFADTEHKVNCADRKD